jgi:hypothetical protein
MKGCCSMQRMQNIVLIVFVGVAFAMQASIDERRELGKNVRGKAARPYYVENYTADQADIIPLVVAMCVEHNHIIDVDALPNLIERSKTVVKVKPNVQSEKYMDAQNVKYDIMHLYSRVMNVFESSGASKDICIQLENEKKRAAKRVQSRLLSRLPKEKAGRQARKADGRQAECMRKFKVKKKQQAVDSNQETANKENNNLQLQQVGQAATCVRQPQLTIQTFTNVYDPIEIHNNVVDDAHEFKKSRHSPIEQRVAEILVSGIQVKDFHKQYFPELKMSSNTEIQ